MALIRLKFGMPQMILCPRSETRGSAGGSVSLEACYCNLILPFREDQGGPLIHVPKSRTEVKILEFVLAQDNNTLAPEVVSTSQTAAFPSAEEPGWEMVERHNMGKRWRRYYAHFEASKIRSVQLRKNG